MNIEQLKLIIEMLQGMGEGVKDITLLWLWLTFGGKLLEGLLWVGTVTFIAYVITRVVTDLKLLVQSKPPTALPHPKETHHD